MLTHLWPAMRSPGTTSVTRSMSTNGQRCGRIWRIRSISIAPALFTLLIELPSPKLMAPVELREGPQPPNAAHCGISCHGDPGRYIPDDAALGGDARAVADDDVVRDAHLPA